MRKVWVVSIVVLSLVFAGIACSILEREVPLDNTDIVISERMDHSNDSDKEGVEVASLDLSKVWTPSNLQSYRAEYHMETWFGDDTNESTLIMTMTYEVTSNPPAQHVISIYEGEMLPEELPTMEMEMYILEGILYSKSYLFDGWVAYESELADFMSDTLLNPQDYVILPEKAERKTTSETINGILTWHYTYDENDIENPPVTYEEANVEVWIAVEGGFIVKLESNAKGAKLSNDLDENSIFGTIENSSIRTTYEMTDINDVFTIVLPPEAAEAEILDLFGDMDFDTEWTREDIPFPEEAEIQYSFESTISLHTALTVQQTKDFMLPQLLAKGWVLEMEHLNSEESYLGDYIKDDDFLSLSIDKDILEPEWTSIHAEVKKIVEWTRTDIPLPQDAFIEHSFDGEVQLLTSLSVQEATDSMITQLTANGWSSEIELIRTEDSFIGTFSKEIEVLSLTINPAFDNEGRTSVVITVE